MSADWPEFTFPFPSDIKVRKKAEKTAKAKWSEQCMRDLELFLTINHTNEFTSEDFKVWCLETLHRATPADGRTWSAIWCGAVRSGRVVLVERRYVLCKTRNDRKKLKTNIYKRAYR